LNSFKWKLSGFFFAFVLLSLKTKGGSGIEWYSTPLTILSGQVIEVSPSHETRQVKLEYKNRKSGSWELITTGHLPESAEGKLYFKLPMDLNRSQVRFSEKSSATFPFSFVQGRSSFTARKSDMTSSSILRSVAMEDASLSSEEITAPAEGTDNVRESDLWRILQNKLYYFNQFRGLQVIDLSDPTSPKVESRYRLPASGEQMYVTDSGQYAFLITQKAHQGWPYQSEIRILKIEGESITEITSLELNGTYRESRLIGDRLFIISEKWEKDNMEANGWAFSYSTRLQTFDLRDPENPKALNEQVIAGAPQVISATNTNLIVVTRDPMNYYYNHVVHVFDLTNFEGIPEPIAKINPGGKVLDKYKLRIRDKTLTIISQAYRFNSWSNRYSLLENFDLKTGKQVGSIELADQETLYATTFEGDYAYIVTFLQTDPLFIVDLSSPEKPKLVSELIVPGWSEYIQPLGDQLFAVGVEDSRVTASLFDVSDKNRPTLVDRIYMGNENEYSWSEANYDEKAIGQFPEMKTFFIPFLSWHANRYKNQIQIIEVENDRLISRGTINHRFQARRSAPDEYGTKIFSISGKDLQVTDYTNPNLPIPLTTFPLAWKVDEVFLHGDYLIQLDSKRADYWGWIDQTEEVNSTLRVSPQAEPDQLITSLNLGEGRLLGSLIQSDILHIAMAKDKSLQIMALKIEKDGKVKQMGQQIVPTQLNLSNAQLEGFQMENGYICWASAPSQATLYPYFRRSLIMEDYPYYQPEHNPIEVHVFSLDTLFDQAMITHESNASIEFPDNSKWSSPILLGNQLLYGSQETAFKYDAQNIWQVVDAEVSYRLQRFDLVEPEQINILPPLSAPGLLTGAQLLSQNSQEAYLYFESLDSEVGIYHPWGRAAAEKDFGHTLASCAFDGANIYFLDELEIDVASPSLAIGEGIIFIAQNEEKGGGVQSYQLNESGMLQKHSILFQNQNIIDLATKRSLVVAQGSEAMLFSNFETSSSSDYFKASISGNFNPNLQKFTFNSAKVFIPSGDYGVETFDLSLPESSELRRLAYNRRNSPESETWKEIEKNQLKVFGIQEAPVIFNESNAADWTFRKNSIFDQTSNGKEIHWKTSSWFGNFYARGYPWLYHQHLGWIYVAEDADSGVWLWRQKSGWLWTTPNLFPYAFEHDSRQWIFFDFTDKSGLLRFYEYGNSEWSHE
jgi:hypothetical protein